MGETKLVSLPSRRPANTLRRLADGFLGFPKIEPISIRLGACIMTSKWKNLSMRAKSQMPRTPKRPLRQTHFIIQDGNSPVFPMYVYSLAAGSLGKYKL